jgi:hypothetical protein
MKLYRYNCNQYVQSVSGHPEHYPGGFRYKMSPVSTRNCLAGKPVVPGASRGMMLR